MDYTSKMLVLFLSLIILGTSTYSFITAQDIGNQKEKEDQMYVSGSTGAFALIILIIVIISFFTKKKAK